MTCILRRSIWRTKLLPFFPPSVQSFFRNQLFSGHTRLLSVCKLMIQPSSLQIDSDNQNKHIHYESKEQDSQVIQPHSFKFVYPKHTALKKKRN